MKSNVKFDASGINGLIIDENNSFELLNGMQFLLLNSKSKMLYPEQKEEWERLRILANDLSKAANCPLIDTLKVPYFS